MNPNNIHLDMIEKYYQEGMLDIKENHQAKMKKICHMKTKKVKVDKELKLDPNVYELTEEGH